MRVPKLGAAVVATVAALTMSGCGIEGPGVAAKVGDETVSTADVNRLTDGYCRALEPQITSQGQVVPMRLVRSYVAGSLTVEAAAKQLAAENGITTPDGYLDRLKELQTQAQGLPAKYRDDFIEVGSARAYVTALETQLGGILLGNENKNDATDDQKLARGQDALTVWLGDHDVAINPRYGIEIAGGTVKDTDTDTSYPLSERALMAGKFDSDTGPDQAYTAALPESQRCG